MAREIDPVKDLLENLNEHPGEAFIYPTGKWLAFATGPQWELVCIITAGTGKNFNTMTDEEINAHIVNTPKKGVIYV